MASTKVAQSQPTQLTLPELLETLVAERRKLQQSIHSRNTLTNYAADWRTFQAWCGTMEMQALPATVDTVALYVTHLLHIGRKISTAMRHTSSIGFYHREAGHPSPINSEIWTLLAGAKRLKRETPDQKAALTLRPLKASCRKMRANDPATLRDRAVLLFGFATALRRSNLVALDLADIRRVSRGLLVTIRREKQDQWGPGRQIPVPRGQHAASCPVRALEKWIRARGHEPGPLFHAVQGERQPGRRLGAARVGKIVKAAVERIGLDPTEYSAHSMRAGFVTECLERGVGELRIAAQTGHRSLQSLRRYHRPTDPFRGNACLDLGL